MPRATARSLMEKSVACHTGLSRRRLPLLKLPGRLQVTLSREVTAPDDAQRCRVLPRDCPQKWLLCELKTPHRDMWHRLRGSGAFPRTPAACRHTLSFRCTRRQENSPRSFNISSSLTPLRNTLTGAEQLLTQRVAMTQRQRQRVRDICWPRQSGYLQLPGNCPLHLIL